jgi:hypothetical protein
LFGLLAVEVAEVLRHRGGEQGAGLIYGLATLFLVLGCGAVWYSFYGMRIGTTNESEPE